MTFCILNPDFEIRLQTRKRIENIYSNVLFFIRRLREHFPNRADQTNFLCCLFDWPKIQFRCKPEPNQSTRVCSHIDSNTQYILTDMFKANVWAQGSWKLIIPPKTRRRFFLRLLYFLLLPTSLLRSPFVGGLAQIT